MYSSTAVVYTLHSIDKRVTGYTYTAPTTFALFIAALGVNIAVGATELQMKQTSQTRVKQNLPKRHPDDDRAIDTLPPGQGNT